MTDFVSTWNEESFLTTPVAPLGLIAMRGTEDMGDKVNKWLLKWRKYTEETLPGDMSTTPVWVARTSSCAQPARASATAKARD